ncbi:uncharacterized protein MELLADRAFT_104933 [Melampsora larici-populina 98AG31]|uniref:Uncharacterized protein n=1 Tax=Melampsora larici-populina (strain 98AG31 / pathotype 3-4-7) TaxID=747676 RepID=F4RGJ9_MELLP|nr:uncharacterized protein MELLADRAFT_104933 [Melampsora larici-populina 98AG31]EGG08520.1 hypothetical protein MELLADRAFT_104933 [Melampsora larici-populina 98AG31]
MARIGLRGRRAPVYGGSVAKMRGDKKVIMCSPILLDTSQSAKHASGETVARVKEASKGLVDLDKLWNSTQRYEPIFVLRQLEDFPSTRIDLAIDDSIMDAGSVHVRL